MTTSSPTSLLNTEEPGITSSGFTYVMCTILVLTAIAASFGNLMVMMVILRSIKLHNITWGLLLNLATSDFLSASLLVPMVISMQPLMNSDPQAWLCTLTGFTYTVLAEASIWTLALLSIERYIAVNQPLHYHQRVTTKRATVAVCSLWICALIWGCVPLLSLSGYSFHQQFHMCLPAFEVTATLAFTGIGICLPFIILCCMYISIGRTAFTQAQRKVIECNKDNCRYVAPKHKDYRAVKILAILAGVFATCWLPFSIVTVITQFITDLKYSLCQLSLALTLMNAAINPWLYSILNRAFRTAACKQYKILRGRLRVSCNYDDNKVCSPPSDIELKQSNFNKKTSQGSQCKLKETDIEHKQEPLLPNQVSRPQTVSSHSSQLHMSVPRNKTI